MKEILAGGEASWRPVGPLKTIRIRSPVGQLILCSGLCDSEFGNHKLGFTVMAEGDSLIRIH